MTRMSDDDHVNANAIRANYLVDEHSAGLSLSLAHLGGIFEGEAQRLI